MQMAWNAVVCHAAPVHSVLEDLCCLQDVPLTLNHAPEQLRYTCIFMNGDDPQYEPEMSPGFAWLSHWLVKHTCIVLALLSCTAASGLLSTAGQAC